MIWIRIHTSDHGLELDPGGPKTYGSNGSGSATMVATQLMTDLHVLKLYVGDPQLLHLENLVVAGPLVERIRPLREVVHHVSLSSSHKQHARKPQKMLKAQGYKEYENIRVCTNP
jgi:hypothetical protein